MFHSNTRPNADIIYEKTDWFVEAVELRPDYTLVLDFANGERRLYDAHELLFEKSTHTRDEAYPELRSRHSAG